MYDYKSLRSTCFKIFPIFTAESHCHELVELD